MFQLTILTPVKKMLVDVEVEEVFVPAFGGEMHILPGHSPLMTTMKTGVLRYKTAGEEKTVAISWGYAQVSPTGMSVLAETAETPEEIDTDRAKAAEARAAKELENLDMEAKLIERSLAKLERAKVRQDILH